MKVSRDRGAAWFLGVLLLCLAACQSSYAPAPRTTDPKPQPQVKPAAAIAPTPTPPPMPAKSPIGPLPGSVQVGDVDSPLIRVLLRRTTDTVSLPQPGRAYRARFPGGQRWLWGPLEINSISKKMWQVGAFADETSLRKAERQLVKTLGKSIELDRQPSQRGLIRLRVGWRGNEPSNAKQRLINAGFGEAYPVEAGATVRIIDKTGDPLESAHEVIVEPADDWPVTVGSRRYRGRFLARASGNELLVINELNLERYLQGVVPVEMGPSQFPELEALKAQAVAARTYAVNHLGDHAEEGYDICSTPACQAYHGFGAEHRLTNRAVSETAGLVAVFEGRPIDAMYTSTCGGHTDAAADIFPDRAQPYLVAVPCSWERALVLEGNQPVTSWMSSSQLDAQLAARALGISDGAETSTQVVDQIARRTGGQPLGHSHRTPEAFADALLRGAKLDSAASNLTAGADAVERLLGLADLYGAELRPPTDAWRETWSLEAGLAVLEIVGVAKRDSGELVPHPEGVAIYPRRADRSEPLVNPLPLYEAWRNSRRSVARLEVKPGTKVERVRLEGRLVALSVFRSGGGGEADRRSSWRSWAREKSWAEIERKLGVSDLLRIEVTRRTANGRVIGLAAVSRSGARKEWSGFDVRRALELPENLFTVQVLASPDGGSTVRFLGRAWGHGVGLCQNGAYGLARAGMTFDRILSTYYPGTQIAAQQDLLAPTVQAKE